MIEITKVFQNTDEINKYLFKDTTPFAYCKAVVEDMIAEITEYLNGKRDDDGFDSESAAAHRLSFRFRTRRMACGIHSFAALLFLSSITLPRKSREKNTPKNPVKPD